MDFTKEVYLRGIHALLDSSNTSQRITLQINLKEVRHHQTKNLAHLKNYLQMFPQLLLENSDSFSNKIPIQVTRKEKLLRLKKRHS